MKGIKVLVVAFIATLALSQAGVLAYSTAPYQISNVKVGGADASVYRSAARTKVNAGNQTLTNISQSTSMETKLEYYNEALGGWYDGYAGYIVLTGSSFTYPSNGVTEYYPALMLGDYRAKIAQTSWHLTDGTFSALYSPGN